MGKILTLKSPSLAIDKSAYTGSLTENKNSKANKYTNYHSSVTTVILNIVKTSTCGSTEQYYIENIPQHQFLFEVLQLPHQLAQLF